MITRVSVEVLFADGHSEWLYASDVVEACHKIYNYAAENELSLVSTEVHTSFLHVKYKDKKGAVIRFIGEDETLPI